MKPSVSNYRIKTKDFCCGIVVNQNNIIMRTAPILNRFKGQDIINLYTWLNENFEDYKITGE